jgi:NAD(P)-dependent dehydrogenase (short-subunit alcohol dehydrogenase family)
MTPTANKTAIVTGAAQGVGLAAAQLLVKRGYNVVLSDVNADAGEEAVATINKEAGIAAAFFVPCDLANTDEIDNLVKTTVDKFSGFSILINNAGFLRAPFLAISAQHIKDTIAINLTATIYTTHQAIRFWEDHPDIKGQVVNITSSSSFKTYASIAAYGAAKAGAAQFTFACRSFGPRIRVNAVAPTAIATAFDKNTMMRVPTEKSGPGYTPEEEMRAMGLARLQPEEVARAAMECIDDEARFGKVVYLDATEGQRIHSRFLPE